MTEFGARPEPARRGLVRIGAGGCAVLLGIAAIVASTLEWVDLSDLGLQALKPSGVGSGYPSLGLWFGLGWISIGLGCLMVCAGILTVLSDVRYMAMVMGCGVSCVVIALAVCARPLGVLPREVVNAC